ncbi:hypothetical protein MESS2_1640023 [Mesorhizobium metallidurans STM 2683]|uniref:H repeat-associated protein N-terminal domain-containing protein n=1 Tax=Mesorhizobium metallidurans STM 2683 TaxID=1297569 RepID=M5ENE5_9HYPH|nr:hypothetical protein [Mesorhizobium metallidurans]CCV05695.1 hypothetical protein MESS2_1640023 [Mesorhizobium metallidurans STM 2683]
MAQALSIISATSRIPRPGMVVYPPREILLTVLAALLCRAEDFDEIEDVSVELLDCLRRIGPQSLTHIKATTLTAARLTEARKDSNSVTGTKEPSSDCYFV